ncbi:hypothetical protein [Mycolicibacterium sp. lyk4-40-TYG-92]|uniref:hypothetical protein n=1 Tax=Mycolicibacterium sp. lyk4-40-TYG-92 TaxID=3040295 RepID=UPI002551B0E0|nr:hypothetical protein [Mycolicibacterium sp. lyk4-40-TYG-92]
MLDKPKELGRKAVTSLRKRGPIFWAMAAGIAVTIALIAGSQIESSGRKQI